MNTGILTLILCSFITFTNVSALKKSVPKKTSALLATQQAVSNLPYASQSQFVEIQSILSSLTPPQQRRLITNMHEQVSLMRDSTLSGAAFAAQESVNKLQSILKGGNLSSALQTQLMSIIYSIINLINTVSPPQQTAIVQEIDGITGIITALGADQTAQLAIQNQIFKTRRVLSSLGISPQTNFFTFVKDLASLIQSSGLSSCTLSYRDLQSELYSSMLELAKYVTAFTTDDDRTVQIDLHRDMLMTRQRLNSLTAASQLTFFQNINDLASLAIADISLSGFQLKNQTAMVGILKSVQSCTIDLQNRFVQQLADDTTLMLSKEPERIYQADIQSYIIAARKELSGLSVEKQIDFFKNVLSSAQIVTGSPQVSRDTIAIEQNISGIKAAALNFTAEEQINLWSQIRELVTFISGLSNSGTQKREDHIALQSNTRASQETLKNVENTDRVSFFTYTNSAAAFIAALNNTGARLRKDHITILTDSLVIQRILQDVINTDRTNFYKYMNDSAIFIAGLNNTGTQLRSDHIALLSNGFTIQQKVKDIANTDRTNFYKYMNDLTAFIVGLNDTDNQLRSDHIALQPGILTIQQILKDVANTDRQNFYDNENNVAAFIAGLTGIGTQLRSDHIALQSKILTIQQILKDVANTDRQNFYDNENNVAAFIAGLNNTGTQLRSEHLALQPKILTIQQILKDVANTDRQNFYDNENNVVTFIAGLNNTGTQLRSDHIALQPRILTIQQILKDVANTDRQNFYDNENALASLVADSGNAIKTSALIILQSKILDTQKVLKDIPVAAQQAFFNTLETMANNVKEKVGTSTDEGFATQTATYMVTPGGIAKRAHAIKTSTSGLNDLTAFIAPNFLSDKVKVAGFGTNLIAFLKTDSYGRESYENLKNKLNKVEATDYDMGYTNTAKLTNLKKKIAEQYTDSNFYFAPSQNLILKNLKAAMELGETSYALVRSLALNLLVSAELGV